MNTSTGLTVEVTKGEKKQWTVANKERDVLVRARSLIYVKLEMGHKYRKTNRKLDLDMVVLNMLW